MEETIADLYYIMEYAAYTRKQLEYGHAPLMGNVNRMAELAEKVRNTLDPKFSEWVENEARR